MQSTSDGIVPKENDTFGENHAYTHTLNHYNIRGQHEALMFSKSRVCSGKVTESVSVTSMLSCPIAETGKLTTLCHTAAFTGVIPKGTSCCSKPVFLFFFNGF